MGKTWSKISVGAVCAVCAAVSVTSSLGCPRKPKATVQAPSPSASPSRVDPNLAGPKQVEPKRVDSNQVDPNRVVVTVNGTAITEAQVGLRVRQQLSQMAAGRSLQPEMLQQLAPQFRPQAVESLIVEDLLVEQVRESNMAPGESEVMARVQAIAAEQRPALSVDQFKAMVQERGLDFNDVKQQIGRGMGIQKLVEGQRAGKVNVTEADANSYYVGHPKEFEVPEQVKVSHILIQPNSTDPNADPNATKALARKKAEDLLAQVKEGKDFAALAKDNSACPSAKDGGDLGFIDRGKTVAPFEEAAFALEPNQISGVVETQYGYHILKVAERKQAQQTPFAEAKAQIMAKLTQDRNLEITRQYIDSLKAKATIVHPGTAQ